MIQAFSPDHLLGVAPALLPLLMAVCGWLTLRLAQWSSLIPRRPVGVRSWFGWQGYFYAHLSDFINHWSRELLERLGTIDQVFEQIGPEKIVSHQLARLRPQLDSFIDEVMTNQNRVLWENMPILVKNRFYARTHRMLPRIIDDIVEELGDNVRRMVTYQQLFEFAEKDNPGTLLRFYHALTLRSFNKLAWLCLYCGLAAGAVQLMVAAPLHLLQNETYWLITAIAIGTGFFWLCQNWLQFPLAPVKLGSFTWRSPYSRLREQQDRELATLLAQTVLSPRNIARALILGSKSRHAQTIIKKRIAPLMDDLNVRTVAQLTVGPLGYVNLKQSLSDKLTESFMEPFEDEEFNQARGKALTEFLLSRIEKLPDQLFYQQMKWVLDPLAIAGTCGGFILGGLIGSLQWLLFSL